MKLQSIFVSYLLLPIISFLLAIILLFFNKINTFANTKDIILFVLGFSLLIAIPGLFTFAEVSFIPLYYTIVQIVYLFIGFFYQQKLDSFFNQADQLFSKSMMILTTTIILCLGSYIFSLIFNYFGELDYGLIASTCTYPIIIPVFLNWAYKALLKIPSEIYKIWKYNNQYNDTIFSSEAIDKIIVIELELSKNIDDLENIKVKAKAPLTFLFGDWFQMFIHDHNIKYSEKPISYSSDGTPDGWIFYTKPTLTQGKKYIDFEKSIEDNELTNENITIVCKRVSIV
jgi:hypothetical protein